MAACIAETVVSRSATTVEIDTFITVPSSTMTNWAAPRMMTTDHFFTNRTWLPELVLPVSMAAPCGSDDSGEPRVVRTAEALLLRLQDQRVLR